MRRGSTATSSVIDSRISCIPVGSAPAVRRSAPPRRPAPSRPVSGYSAAAGRSSRRSACRLQNGGGRLMRQLEHRRGRVASGSEFAEETGKGSRPTDSRAERSGQPDRGMAGPPPIRLSAPSWRAASIGPRVPRCSARACWMMTRTAKSLSLLSAASRRRTASRGAVAVRFPVYCRAPSATIVTVRASRVVHRQPEDGSTASTP